MFKTMFFELTIDDMLEIAECAIESYKYYNDAALARDHAVRDFSVDYLCSKLLEVQRRFPVEDD